LAARLAAAGRGADARTDARTAECRRSEIPKALFG